MKRQVSDFDRLPKRVKAIIETMRQHGWVLCKDIRHTEAGVAEINFCLEPGGRRVGPKSAEAAVNSGLLQPNNDGLLGPETSQTWKAA